MWILSFRFLEKRSFVRNEKCQKQMSSKAIFITMSHLKFRPDHPRALLKNIFLNIYSIQNCFSRSNSILLAITPQKKIVDKFSSTLHTMKKVNIHSTSYNATFEVEKQKSRILGVYRCKVEASEQTSSRASPLYNAKVSYETA